MAKKKLKKGAKTFLLVILGIIALIVLIDTGIYVYKLNYKLKPVEKHEENRYYASDFGIIHEKYKFDYDQDGIDDYSDILEGEKKIAEINPKYVNKYYAEGYPPEGEGTCTDIIWYSLLNAGYNLRDMMDTDIRLNRDDYNIPIIDNNIDFRRVVNINIFLKKYAEVLSNDIYDLKEWLPGDIVVFDNSDHIAMISDYVNKEGVIWVVQNSDPEQEEKEEDVLIDATMRITGHYRLTYNDKLKELIKQIPN